ncbi:MAG: hypothetical protein CM15mP49_05290 [Actinomycetota bacterium]|nr:MAG: hypothetical protein CM15mP49_05290 [Actinomycetota bacterium]
MYSLATFTNIEPLFIFENLDSSKRSLVSIVDGAAITTTSDSREAHRYQKTSKDDQLNRERIVPVVFAAQYSHSECFSPVCDFFTY